MRARFRHAILFAGLGLLASCAVPPSSSPAPSIAPATPQVAGGAVVESQAPMAKPADAIASLVLVRVESAGPEASLNAQQTGVLRGRPVDPTTLADISGFTPLALSHHYRAALSPDGRTLATIVWPSGSSNAGGVLHLVDPVAWTDRATGIELNDSAVWFDWSTDGSRLLWMRSIASDPSKAAYAVFGADLATLAPREVVELPSGFQPHQVRLVGSRLAVVGAPNERNLVTADANVIVIDLATSQIASQIRLPGVRLGQFEVDEPGLYPYRQILPALAWDLPRGRLVVVDAERDNLHIVDLARATQSGPLAIRKSASSKGPAGGAKMTSTTHKVAALSPDGRWLYVAGLREDLPSDRPDKAELRPMALQRIDLTDLRETARIAAAGKHLWLSSDGTRLVLGGDDARLLDANDLSEIARVGSAPDSWVVAERSGIAYIASHPPYPRGPVVRAFDVTSGRIIASREIDRHFAEFITLR